MDSFMPKVTVGAGTNRSLRRFRYRHFAVVHKKEGSERVPFVKAKVADAKNAADMEDRPKTDCFEPFGSQGGVCASRLLLA